MIEIHCNIGQVFAEEWSRASFHLSNVNRCHPVAKEKGSLAGSPSSSTLDRNLTISRSERGTGADEVTVQDGAGMLEEQQGRPVAVVGAGDEFEGGARWTPVYEIDRHLQV